METLSTVLPIVIDCLIAGLLVALIVLIIKIIGVVDDARLLIDNIVDKVNTVNGLFSIIKKIVFANGRTEEFGNTLNIKVITGESQWRDVVITYNAADVRGLEKVGEVSKASGWGGMLASGHGYNKAIELLQKEAARMRCGVILIVDAPNRNNTAYGAGARVNASAYRIRMSSSSTEDYSELTGIAQQFADGTINERPSSTQTKLAIDLSREVLKDYNDGRMDLARKKYDVLMKWYSGKNKDTRIEQSLKNIIF